jgi:soluble lytic murein transglycosylase-like protein
MNRMRTMKKRSKRLSATQKLTMRGVVLLALVLTAGGVVGATVPRAAASGDDGIAYTGTAVGSQFRLLRTALDTTSGQLELTRLKLERAERLLEYSAKYQIPADLAALIYDTALQVGLDPELAFRLVNIESGFKVKAVSSANALGLAQVQLPTARFYDPDITREELFEPATNLRIGFRYLRDLLRVYGDTKLALLAYNRGPARLKQLMDQGHDPANGYASKVMSGYLPR